MPGSSQPTQTVLMCLGGVGRQHEAGWVGGGGGSGRYWGGDKYIPNVLWNYQKLISIIKDKIKNFGFGE